MGSLSINKIISPAVALVFSLGAALAPATMTNAQSVDVNMLPAVVTGNPIMNSSGSEGFLLPLNNSLTHGDVTMSVSGDQVTVTLRTESASPNLPHAQHLRIGGNNICPAIEHDDNDDHLITTEEAESEFGDIAVSLTTSGDVSADSALDMDHFPVADANGVVDYERTFTLPDGVSASDLNNVIVVQHGISEIFGSMTEYDGDMKSSLDENRNFEETAPAACAELKTEESTVAATSAGQRLAFGGMGGGSPIGPATVTNGDKTTPPSNGGGGTGGNGEKPNDNDGEKPKPPSFEVDAVIENTGPESNNVIDIDHDEDIQIKNDNNFDFSYSNNQDATTGDATVTNNTQTTDAGSGDAGNTADSQIKAKIEN